MHIIHTRTVASVVAILGALVGLRSVYADIYLWDNNELIPGTEGIEPGRGCS